MQLRKSFSLFSIVATAAVLFMAPLSAQAAPTVTAKHFVDDTLTVSVRGAEEGDVICLRSEYERDGRRYEKDHGCQNGAAADRFGQIEVHPSAPNGRYASVWQVFYQIKHTDGDASIPASTVVQGIPVDDSGDDGDDDGDDDGEDLSPVVGSVRGCKLETASDCDSQFVNPGDKSIIIKGQNLRPLTSVKINGQSVTPILTTATDITVQLPSAARIGNYEIEVVTPEGETTFMLKVEDPAGPGGNTGNTGGPGGNTGPGGTSNLPCESQGLQPDPSGSGLCLPGNPIGVKPGSLAASTSVGDLIRRILNILLTLGGVVAVLFIVIGGYQYITSRGNEDQAKSGRKTMTYALVGLIAILLAYTLVTIITRTLTTGDLFS